MPKRDPQQVFLDLIAAGMPPRAAVTMTAIAGAESGYDDTELGDVSLENATWGPSDGTYQIRTLKAATGTGSDRDLSWLAASDANQAKAAVDISKGGTDFTPWTTYDTGRYQDFLTQAQAAAGAAPATTTANTTGGSSGPWWLPWNLPGVIASNTLSGARSVVLEGLAVVLGVGLLVAGGVRLAQPRLQRAQRDAAAVLPAVL